MKRRLFIFVIGAMLASLILAACGGGAQEVSTVDVATDATWPPFEMVNEETKELEGFDIELMNEVARVAGFEVEYHNVSFDSLLAGVAQCQYDAAISAITITEDRAEEMLFSDPYFEAGQVVTVRQENTDINSQADLSGKTVGAQIGTTGAIEVERMEGASLKTYDDVSLAFQDLMNGQIDAVVADNPLALSYVGENPDRLKTVGEVFTEENYGIALCEQNTDLAEQINGALAELEANGFIDQLSQKWLQGGG